MNQTPIKYESYYHDEETGLNIRIRDIDDVPKSLANVAAKAFQEIAKLKAEIKALKEAK
jgi:hypothetical protein